ncbi:MAG TPA: lipopolysaccharide kinase InaA family protein [Candidatus Limnocylindria bacterium]|nr:lipopolysaccharide kinase InaA family protein [Candidatus Limnocylindria bacterium]
MIQRTHNQFRWQLADDFAPLLEAVLSAPPQIVKESDAKLVARHEVNGRSFYVKRYRHSAFPFRPLKFILKKSQAAQEWRLVAEMEERRVPIVRHVALGERWTTRGLMESVLVTEAFDGGAPLDESHHAHFPRVVEFVRELALTGVAHFDLHPSNLLVNLQSGEIRLVDLHGAKVFENEVPTECGDIMLAQLCVTLPLPVSHEVRETAKALRRDQFAERSKRCLKTNRDFGIRKSGPLRWHVRSASLTPEVEAAMRDPNEFLTRAKVLKAGRSATVGAAHGLVLKRYNFKKPLNLLKDLFRGSRGRRGFRKAYHLELCGFPTPRVIAAGERRVLGFPIRSYVLMAEVRDAVDAGRWSGETPHTLAHFIARLHEEGFTHRDLKQTNILFDRDGGPHLIDLDGLEFTDVLKASKAAADLRRLAKGMDDAGKLTRRNVFTFLRIYCRERKLRPRNLFPRERFRP